MVGAVGHFGQWSGEVELFERFGGAGGDQPEVPRLKHERVRDDAGPFDRILKLANVSGPLMLLYRRDRFSTQLRFATAQLATNLSSDMAGEEDAIFAARSQWRPFQRKER